MNSYLGRFAPSPTGSLHFGSLFAAVISYLEARSHRGKWLVRIEDIDPLREQAGSQQAILDTLSAHGLEWDEVPRLQSSQSTLYEQTLKLFASKKLSYACPCSRKQLLEQNGLHTKICQNGLASAPYAIKFKTPKQTYTWQDGIQGTLSQVLNEDFVLKRKEGFYAYQLAVVCDDISQGITHVVRGYDLLTSTPMQLALYDALEVKPPVYSHFPVLENSHGQKLSKQNFADPVDDHQALDNLLAIFRLLNISLSPAPRSVQEALSRALSAWNIDLVPAKKSINLTN